MADLVLKADPRTAMGKKNRALRASGIIPIHVYGLDDAPQSLQAEGRRLISVVREAGRTSPVIVEPTMAAPMSLWSEKSLRIQCRATFCTSIFAS